jgi:shikimate 5-dehydrogenase
MLVYQGAIAFELWTGREAPVNIMFKAAEKAL